MAKTDVLKDIVAKKKERLALAKQALPFEELKVKAGSVEPARPFIEAVNKPRVISLIAEIKQQSPSHGVIRQDFNPSEIAGVYQDAGVQAVSVLTEQDFFAGSPEYIGVVKARVTGPVLRKDFILEPYQIYESRYYGADAVLLIADLLSKDSLVEMIGLADSLGMDCIVEVHDEKELKKVLGLKVAPPAGETAPAKKDKKAQVKFCIGINTRDLRTLQTDPKVTERLYPMIPKDRVVIVESGIKSYQDILFLKVLGVNAVLVGGSILAAADMKMFIQDLMGW
ncbi:MAG: indole-3-glycerol phosphate synthase TrpC [Candidatus Omnitrophica bacterium]|jgi:indole-3-glycerol phosphate synthase|nr:indole-3-glycerol phosphate synthase TrpC [Candidatus Omnitrophota bacterium]